MNKKKVILIALCVCLCIILFMAYIINPFAGDPKVKVSNGAFDITVDEFIDTLNADIAKQNLEQIPKNYIVCEHKTRTVYRCKINNRLMVRFVKYKDSGDKIARVGISYLDFGEHSYPQKEALYEPSPKDKKKALKYYQILSDNVAPGFKVGWFCCKNAESLVTFKWHDIIFYRGSTVVGSSDVTENVYTYEVISSKSLYEKYEEAIKLDDDKFFVRDVDHR